MQATLLPPFQTPTGSAASSYEQKPDWRFLTTMVNISIKVPHFCLQALKNAAACKSFTISTRAKVDAEVLEHDTEAVRQVVLRLEPSDFDHVWILRDEKKKPRLDENGNEIVMDVYTPLVRTPNGDSCKVYLKIVLRGNTACITSVQSFHQQRK